MNEKFKLGLSYQVFTEFDEVRKLRECFIASGVRSKHVETLEEVLNKMFSLYLDLTATTE